MLTGVPVRGRVEMAPVFVRSLSQQPEATFAPASVWIDQPQLSSAKHTFTP